MKTFASIRIKKRGLLIFLIVGITLTTKSFSQSLPNSTIKKIDSLFIKWDNKNSPGCAIGIVRNDSLIYAKGYGMANLEYNIPITPETIFYMASVSKQFTAYAIVLLSRQGKIRLGDDIHVYLPWFPNLRQKITVRNLLNHTSGIRDVFGLAAISGVGGDGMMTQELAFKLLKRQTSLNFNPGEKYSYSNSNFILLSEIVKNVSGRTFQAFADSAIFKPLGMSESHFEDDYYELIKNRAESYSAIDSAHYENSFKNVFTMGDGGLFSNINDMAKWIINFYNPRAGDLKDIAQLTLKGKLNNGKELLYASGIVSNKYKGWRVYTHMGGLSGYRTMTAAYPDLKMGIIVFGNQGDLSTYSKINQIADLLITDTTAGVTREEQLIKGNTNERLNNGVDLSRIVGDYISNEGLEMHFRSSNNRLYANAFGGSFFLTKGNMDSLSYFFDPLLMFSFSSSTSKGSYVLTSFPAEDDEKYMLKKYVTNTSQADQVLQAYTGIYNCPELDCNYSIILKDQHLLLTTNKYNDARLTLIDVDHLRSDLDGMNNLLMIRNNKNQITGFEVNSGGVMHLRFNKIK
jgi:CubicO group peptidase (beta-lactamase class C family)